MTTPTTRPPRPHRAAAHCPPAQKSAAPRLGVRVRAALFLGLAALALLAVFVVLRPDGAAGEPADQAIQVSMGGFTPAVVTARAGQPLKLRVVNPDSSFHTDGGGWHQFAVPRLGVDARVAPRSESVVEIPAAAPGEYVFYCDICCGGKENPAMRGTLRVVA